MTEECEAHPQRRCTVTRTPTWDDVAALASAVAALNTTAGLGHDTMIELAAPIVRRMAAMVDVLEQDPHGDSEDCGSIVADHIDRIAKGMAVQMGVDPSAYAEQLCGDVQRRGVKVYPRFASGDRVGTKSGHVGVIEQVLSATRVYVVKLDGHILALHDTMIFTFEGAHNGGISAL